MGSEGVRTQKVETPAEEIAVYWKGVERECIWQLYTLDR